MNSGKYLYSNSATKKVPNPKKINVSRLNNYIIQKPQLKYITNETITHFKKFLLRLHKKEEEALLNKKRKREESKQKTKVEKAKINNNSMNNPNHYNYYPPNMYMSPMQINNQNPSYFNEYQNLYYLNPPPQPYQFNPQMLPSHYFSSYMMPINNLQDSLNNIYKRGIVNNIIGAFFIKECQDNKKNNGKRKVPISKVELNDEGGDDNNENNNNNGDTNNNDDNFENNNNFNNDKNWGENLEKEEKDQNRKNNYEEKKNENNDNNGNSNNNKNDNELIKPSIV